MRWDDPASTFFTDDEHSDGDGAGDGEVETVLERLVNLAERDNVRLVDVLARHGVGEPADNDEFGDDC